jgi:hypothetical protein
MQKWLDKDGQFLYGQFSLLIYVTKYKLENILLLFCETYNRKQMP